MVAGWLRCVKLTIPAYVDMLLLRCVFSLLATVLQYCVVLLTVTYDIILLAVIVYCMWLWLWLWLWLFLIFIIFNLLFFTVGFLQWFFTGGLRCKKNSTCIFTVLFHLVHVWISTVFSTVLRIHCCARWYTFSILFTLTVINVTVSVNAKNQN